MYTERKSLTMCPLGVYMCPAEKSLTICILGEHIHATEEKPD